MRRIPAFATISLALMMMSIDSTIIATALHTLQHGLDTTINWAGWTITAYSFGFLVMLPVSGRMSEQYGRRRVFLGSVIAFTLTSLLCGLADNIFVLIALRALQAAGGAGFTPSATGIVVDYFGNQRDRAVSLFGSIFPVGAMLGPIFGGLLVAHWSWRSVFFVNVPIGLVVIAMVLRYIPPDRPRTGAARPGMDATGMGLMGSGLFCMMLAAAALGEPDWGPGPMLAPLAVAAVVLWALFRHLRRVANPFVAPRLIAGPGFGAVNLVNALFGGITSGVVALIPLYATNRYAIGVLGSGTLLIAQGLAAITFSVSAAFALRRTGHRPPIYAGGVVIALGMVLLAMAPPGGLSPWVWLAFATFLIGAGGGGLNPASRNAGLQLAPQSASTLAALRTMSLQIGQILSVALAAAFVSGSADPGATQAVVFIVAAAVLVVALPLIALVPEHHGAW